MGLFNFAKPDASAGQDIQLVVNAETVNVPAAEAAGMTVADLFSRFASNLCDVSASTAMCLLDALLLALLSLKLALFTLLPSLLKPRAASDDSTPHFT